MVYYGSVARHYNRADVYISRSRQVPSQAAGRRYGDGDLQPQPAKTFSDGTLMLKHSHWAGSLSWGPPRRSASVLRIWYNWQSRNVSVGYFTGIEVVRGEARRCGGLRQVSIYRSLRLVMRSRLFARGPLAISFALMKARLEARNFGLQAYLQWSQTACGKTTLECIRQVLRYVAVTQIPAS